MEAKCRRQRNLSPWVCSRTDGYLPIMTGEGRRRSKWIPMLTLWAGDFFVVRVVLHIVGFFFFFFCSILGCRMPIALPPVPAATNKNVSFFGKCPLWGETVPCLEPLVYRPTGLEIVTWKWDPALIKPIKYSIHVGVREGKWGKQREGLAVGVLFLLGRSAKLLPVVPRRQNTFLQSKCRESD